MNLDEQVEEAFKPDIPREHFDLQYQFALKAMELTGKTLEECLMEYTAFYKRIGVKDWQFNSDNPIWQNFLQSARAVGNYAETAYNLFLENEKQRRNIKSPDKIRFGCFRFEYEQPKETITLHFSNQDKSGLGPLSHQRIEQRLKELAEMFKYIKANFPSAKYVAGGSWLYNYEAYRRLFPSTFMNGIGTQEIPFPRSSGIWGQFINSEKEVDEQVKIKFLSKIKEAKNIDELLQTFPMKLLIPKCGIEEFYKFYQIDNET